MVTRASRFPLLPAIIGIAGLAVVQMSVSRYVRNFDTKREYLAPVPSEAAQGALAFGDSQFLHRMFAVQVQNAGDTGGRIVPIRNYDFGRVVGWLEVLERLDPHSIFAIGMADGYFGQTQDLHNIEPIVRFMMRDVALNPPAKWRWLYGAIYLARHRMRDDALGLEVARQLASYEFDGIDPWASMTPAFVLEDMGDYRGASDVVRETVRRFAGRLNHDDTLWTASYLNFLAKVDAGLVPPRRRKWD